MSRAGIIRRKKLEYEFVLACVFGKNHAKTTFVALNKLRQFHPAIGFRVNLAHDFCQLIARFHDLLVG